MYLDDSKNEAQRGFTFLEVLVALAASGILLVILVKFYKDSYRTFNIQEQVAERNQNAYFTLGRLTEMLQQAGSGLPDTGFASITSLTGSAPDYTGLTLITNPRGGVHFVSTRADNATRIPVGDTTSFRSATSILVDFKDSSAASVLSPISSFIAGIAANSMDTIVISPAVTIDTGDMIYAWKSNVIAVSSRNLSIGGIVIAENIDSLSFKFFQNDGVTASTAWNTMRSAKLTVSAGTAFYDLRKIGDPYRKLVLRSSIGFRNKI